MNHVDKGIVEVDAVGTNVVQIELGDVDDHAMEPTVGVIRRQGLMLVFVVVNQFNLADLPGNDPVEDLGQDADLQTPIGGDIEIACQSAGQTELAR